MNNFQKLPSTIQNYVDDFIQFLITNGYVKSPYLDIEADAIKIGYFKFFYPIKFGKDEGVLKKSDMTMHELFLRYGLIKNGKMTDEFITIVHHRIASY